MSLPQSGKSLAEFAPQRAGPPGAPKINMLGRNEFALRQGFRLWRKRLYAPPGAGRESILIRFLPRHVRGKKHFSAHKRTNPALWGECDAGGRNFSMKEAGLSGPASFIDVIVG